MASGSSSHRASAIAVDRMAADSPSDFSDTSSVDSMSVGGRGGGTSAEHSFASQQQQQQQMPPSPASRDQFGKRIDSLQQENRVLKIEVETCKLRIKALQDENKHLRQTSCEQQARAEAEEEYISNTLMKKITTLKKEKEKLACSYEQEEECLTNQLSRKLNKLRQEKVDLEQSLEKEQEVLVNRLMKRIHKLENDVRCKQQTLDQLRREKVELENSLEQEQEALVNKLWIRMHKLEEEKRILQEQLQLPSSAPQSPCATPGLHLTSSGHVAGHGAGSGHRGSGGSSNAGSTSSLAGTHQAHATAAAIMDNENKRHIELLRAEVARLKRKLSRAEKDHTTSMSTMSGEERQLREENTRLHRKLQLEFSKQKTFTGAGNSGSGSGSGNVLVAGGDGGAGAAGIGGGSGGGLSSAGGGGGGGHHHGMEGGSMSVSESEHSLDDQYGDSLAGEDLLNSGPPSNNSNSVTVPSHSLSTNPNLRRQRGRTDSETSFDRGAAGDRASSGIVSNTSSSSAIGGSAGGGISSSSNVPMSPAYSVQASPRSVFHAPSPIYVGNSSGTTQSMAPYLLGIHGSSSAGGAGGGGTGASTPGTHPPPSPMDTASIRSCESPLATFNSAEFPAVPEPLSGGTSASSGSQAGGVYHPVTKRQFISGSSNIAKSGRQTPTPSPSSSSAPSPMAVASISVGSSLAGNAAVVQQQHQQQQSSTPSAPQT